jgi:hypothetical protein
VDVLENEEGLSVIAVTIHVHCLLQRRDFRAHHLITAEALAAIEATLPAMAAMPDRPPRRQSSPGSRSAATLGIYSCDGAAEKSPARGDSNGQAARLGPGGKN